jgi:hypothetical protein
VEPPSEYLVGTIYVEGKLGCNIVIESQGVSLLDVTT